MSSPSSPVLTFISRSVGLESLCFNRRVKDTLDADFFQAQSARKFSKRPTYFINFTGALRNLLRGGGGPKIFASFAC